MIVEKFGTRVLLPTIIYGTISGIWAALQLEKPPYTPIKMLLGMLIVLSSVGFYFALIKIQYGTFSLQGSSSKETQE